MTTPYTYLIGWKEHNLWYYGVRYARGCNPSELWIEYFTSCKRMNSIREQYGEPNVIQIRKTFSDRRSAIEWEHKVLRRMKVIHNNQWINKTDNRAIVLDEQQRKEILLKTTGQKRKPHSEATREKIRQRKLGKEPWNKGKKMNTPHPMRGKHQSEESKEKNRLAHLGKTQSLESNKKRSDKLKGRVLSEETKEKLRQAAIRREEAKRFRLSLEV